MIPLLLPSNIATQQQSSTTVGRNHSSTNDNNRMMSNRESSVSSPKCVVSITRRQVEEDYNSMINAHRHYQQQNQQQSLLNDNHYNNNELSYFFHFLQHGSNDEGQEQRDDVESDEHQTNMFLPKSLNLPTLLCEDALDQGEEEEVNRRRNSAELLQLLPRRSTDLHMLQQRRQSNDTIKDITLSLFDPDELMTVLKRY